LALTGIDVGLPADEAERDFLVFEENWDTVGLFCRLSTQWRVGGMGGFLGLDYAAVDALFRLLRVRDRAGEFTRIQVMERAALDVLNDRSKP
jgi:hypothetical protein